MSRKSENKGGRPTLYKPEYCELVIELGKKGYSLAAMASEIGVHRDTVQQWRKDHEEFSASFARARDYAQAWWEEEGLKGMWAGKVFNAQVWSRSMAARFPDDYTERSDVKLSGSVDIGNAILEARKRTNGEG